MIINKRINVRLVTESDDKTSNCDFGANKSFLRGFKTYCLKLSSFLLVL